MAKRNAVLVDLRRYSEHKSIAGACLKGWALADTLLRDRVDIVLPNPMREIDTDDLVRQIMARRPRLISFSCYVWNIQKVLEVARTLKDADPELAVLLGGPEVSLCAEEFVRGNDRVDYVAPGGRENFSKPFTEIFCGGALESVPGLAYRDSRGVVRAPPRGKLICRRLNRLISTVSSSASRRIRRFPRAPSWRRRAGARSPVSSASGDRATCGTCAGADRKRAALSCRAVFHH